MAFLAVKLVLVINLAGVCGFDICQWLLDDQDCSTSTQSMSCGTNGVTYMNDCFLSQAHCKDAGVHKAHEGPCLKYPEHIGGSKVVLEVLCQDLMSFVCPQDGTKVCGSNGVWYNNLCLFDQARCRNQTLEFQIDLTGYSCGI